MAVMEETSSNRRRAMSSSVFNRRAGGRPRLPRSARQIRSARDLSVEQVAGMVPEWGKLEVRYAGDNRLWIVRSL
jgi:hypothetical protein